MQTPDDFNSASIRKIEIDLINMLTYERSNPAPSTEDHYRVRLTERACEALQLMRCCYDRQGEAYTAEETAQIRPTSYADKVKLLTHLESKGRDILRAQAGFLHNEGSSDLLRPSHMRKWAQTLATNFDMAEIRDAVWRIQDPIEYPGDGLAFLCSLLDGLVSADGDKFCTDPEVYAARAEEDAWGEFWGDHNEISALNPRQYALAREAFLTFGAKAAGQLLDTFVATSPIFKNEATK